MRTTVDLPDDLLAEARERAAQEGGTLTALLADGLRLRLAAAAHPSREQRLAAVDEARSTFTGAYPPDYLARLRDEWPD